MKIIRKIQEYFIGASQELAKVAWPSKQESISLTIIVLISIIVSMLILAGIDWGLSKIVNLLIENNV
jgi:preprotein translocase SecE subunit